MRNSSRRSREGLILGAAAALWLLGAASSALGLQSDEDQPLYLEADSADLDEKRSVSVYRGNVVIQQGSLRIHADEVTMHHREDRQPEKIIAVGNPATYRQELDGEEPTVRAEAQRMEYLRETDEILLFDQAIVFQGEDTFRNDRIIYDRGNARVKAGRNVQGKERVKILINPSKR